MRMLIFIVVLTVAGAVIGYHNFAWYIVGIIAALILRPFSQGSKEAPASQDVWEAYEPHQVQTDTDRDSEQVALETGDAFAPATLRR